MGRPQKSSKKYSEREIKALETNPNVKHVTANNITYSPMFKIAAVLDYNEGPNNGADAHISSSMSLPSVGLWRLDVYFSEELFGSVIVEVYEQK